MWWYFCICFIGDEDETDDPGGQHKASLGKSWRDLIPVIKTDVSSVSISLFMISFCILNKLKNYLLGRRSKAKEKTYWNQNYLIDDPVKNIPNFRNLCIKKSHFLFIHGLGISMEPLLQHDQSESDAEIVIFSLKGKQRRIIVNSGNLIFPSRYLLI